MHGNVDVKMGSERNFGFVFAAVSAIIALAPLFRGHPPRVSFLILALAFAAVAIFAPGLLRWPNRLWFRFGMLLGAIVAPPDAVAATAVARRIGLPRTITTILEGESLLNDATALTLLTVAVTAARSGDFSLPGAVGEFLLAAAGGLVEQVASMVEGAAQGGEAPPPEPPRDPDRDPTPRDER